MKKFHLVTKCVFTLCLLGATYKAHAQVSLKNNLLYDAALTPNASVEVRVKPKWTVALNAGFSPFKIGESSTRRWRHLLVMPEARYWFCEAYSHHFLSVNAVYSHYNIAKLDLPLYSSKHNRYQGDFVGAGISYGYAIPIGRNNHWNIELEAGVDVAYTWYDKYECEHCGSKLGSDDKVFLLPKLAVNLAWVLPHKNFNKERAHACKPVPVLPDTISVDTVDSSEKAVAALEPSYAPSTAEALRTDNPFLAPFKEYRPYDETRILRKEATALYVYFPVDKTTLQRDFRGNAPILDRIEDITRQIMQDNTSIVRRIQIVGIASIEGSESHNCELGQGRAEALKQYLQERIPTPDSIYDLNNGCEAWTEFRDQIHDLQILKAGQKVNAVAGSPTATTLKSITPEVLAGITEKEINDLLDIIDNEPDANKREARIKRMNGGRTYNYLKQHVLADQRNSGYIRVYYDVVPDKAAEAINEAARLVKQERYAEALRVVQPYADDPRAQNTLGVALYMTGQHDKGIEAFRRAARNGDKKAQENLREIGVDK